MLRVGLLVWPDPDGAWREVDRGPDSEAKQAAYRVYEGLHRLNPKAIGAHCDTGQDGEPDGIPYLRFDEGALGLFKEWRTDLEAKLRGAELHPALESHLAKYRQRVPGLALLLHLAGGGTGPVNDTATLQAMAWADYLDTQAKRSSASVSTPEVTAAKAILKRLRNGDLSRRFSSRDGWRPGWTNVDRESVTAALSLRVELDWLSVSRSDTGGRPAMVYAANPKGLK